MTSHFASVKKLKQVLDRDEGCRVGETSVVSRKVHTYNPDEPERLFIVKNSDAGRVFYRREQTGELVHIDVFHSLGRLPVKPLAEAARKAVDDYARAQAADAGLNFAGGIRIHALADYIDIQTGQGGGRITGKLVFGQKPTLKTSHENHVHLAALLSPKDLALVFFLIENIERAIQQEKYELRKVERIVHEVADPRSQQDMSAYSSYTDSFIKEQRINTEASGEELYRLQLMDIADILEELENLEELKKLLHNAHPKVNRRGAPAPSEYPFYWDFQPKVADAWNKLHGYGYVKRSSDRYSLTADGQNLHDFLSRCTRQIECDLRQRVKWAGATVSSSPRGLGGVRYARAKNRRGRALHRKNDMEGSIAIVPTIMESLHRSVEAGEPWSVRRASLRYETQPQKMRLDVCLLIDASASMMGRRMKAAKALAEHLVHSTDDRLAVLYFQEDRVELAVPFTRNQTLLRAGLNSIKPSGLTPLAAGLLRGAEYVRQASSAARALIVVITDGIPTMSHKSGDPLQESLDAAADIGKQGINLCCVGLQPNQKLLDRLAKAAGGSVHTIEEITETELMRILSAERSALS